MEMTPMEKQAVEKWERMTRGERVELSDAEAIMAYNAQYRALPWEVPTDVARADALEAIRRLDRFNVQWTPSGDDEMCTQFQALLLKWERAALPWKELPSDLVEVIRCREEAEYLMMGMRGDDEIAKLTRDLEMLEESMAEEVGEDAYEEAMKVAMDRPHVEM